MEKLLYGLLSIGNITTYSDAGSSMSGINNTLKAAGTVVGGILILLAVIKIIMALADENAAEKTRASMLLGVGIMFISISSVLTTLGIENYNSSTTARFVGYKIANLLGTMCTWAGGALGIAAILMLVFAFSQEQAEGKAKAVHMLTTACGLLGAGALGTRIGNLILIGTTSGDTYMNWIASFIAIVASYAGGCFVIIGVYHMVLGIRTEDSKERDMAVRLLLTGIALISFRAVLTFMGITASYTSIS